MSRHLIGLVSLSCFTSWHLATHIWAEKKVYTPQPDAEDSQEIGALLGVGMGSRSTPGGIAIEGRYLYRVSSKDWLESIVHFNLGRGKRECFRDRQSDYVCEHGLIDGFSAETLLGLRRYLTGQKQYRPYVRGGVGVSLVSFPNDDVKGIAIPFLLGAGVRVEVANRVMVFGDVSTRAGWEFLNQGLGVEPYLSLSVGAGVEFTLE